jgi:hypothetical protein
MTDELIKRLRHADAPYAKPTALEILTDEAAALIEQQAARIAELEAQIAAVAPAVDAQPVAIQAGDDVTVTNVPARIYLNLGDLYEMGEIPFQSLTDVTWCEDRIDDADIEYVRADASAQSEGLRKDAERYRHLRQCNSGSLVIVQIVGTGEDDQIVLTEEHADEAIDAALSQHTGEKDD